MKLFSTSLLWAGTAKIAFAATLTVTPIYVQNKGDPYPPVPPPRMTSSQGKLLVHPFDSDVVTIYSEATLQEEGQVAGFSGAQFLNANAQGWVAGCIDGFPAKVRAFELSAPGKTYDYEFSTDNIQSCSSMSIEMQGDRPIVWTGSTGTREILAIDLKAGQLAVKIPLISGPFNVQKHGDLLVTANSVVGFGSDLPLVFDLNQNKAVVGDPTLMGVSASDNSKGTTLEREYFGEAFVDELTDTISYFNPAASSLRAFSLSKPQEAGAVDQKVSVTVPTIARRFGKCLAVLGASPDQHQRPQWSVIQSSRPGEFIELEATPYSDDLSLRASVFMESGANGDLFLSHQRGVSRVTGLFDGRGC